MDISIAICTYNRSKTLKRCLEALEKANVPEGLLWEILVVDNNSSDDTKDIVESMKQGGKLNIRYVLEKKQGISYARNRSIVEAAGKIVSMLDDDSVPESDWLRNITETFKEYDADCVGGKITPIEWPKKIPKWVNSELYAYMTIYDKGDSVKEIKWYIDTPFGANIAYKKSIFDKVGLFNTSLGRVGLGSTYAGEEQDMTKRILEKGGKVIYQPKAVVHHPIRLEMMAKRYYRTTNFHAGDAYAMMFFGEYDKKNIFGIPLFIFRQFIESVWRYLKAIVRDGYNNSFRKELYSWYFLGFMWGRIKYTYGHKRNHLHV